MPEPRGGWEGPDPSARQTRAEDRLSPTLPAPPHPARLPSGRHRIPDQVVREHQRDRLIEAISVLSAERGYANVVIADIVAAAGVSKSTFYRFHRTKDECLFEAHKRHCAALIAAVDQTCAGEARPAKEQLRIGIRAALTYLSTNPHAAHLLTIGILSCGPRGERRYAVMIDALSNRVQATGALSSPDSALAAVLFAASTIAHTILPREEIKLLALESELVEIFLAIGDRGETHSAPRFDPATRRPPASLAAPPATNSQRPKSSSAVAGAASRRISKSRYA